MKFNACSDIGNVRKENEDSLFVPQIDEDIKLFLVADGIGGQSHGKFASQMTIEEMNKFFLDNYNKYDDYNLLMIDSIKHANKAVFDFANVKSEFSGMGTTLVSAFINKDELLLANAGDSRCYIIRNEIISQLTVDNSYVQYLLEKGAISAEEAFNHPQRNLITKAIGFEKNVEVDVENIKLYPKDILLLCTDGLTTMLSDEDILHIILNEKGNIEQATYSLIKEAKNNGGTDNITVILVEV